MMQIPVFATILTVLARIGALVRGSSWAQTVLGTLAVPAALGAVAYMSADALTPMLLEQVETYMFGNGMDAAMVGIGPHLSTMPTSAVNWPGVWFLVREVLPFDVLLSSFASYLSFTMSMVTIAWARDYSHRRYMSRVRGTWLKPGAYPHNH